MPSTSSTTEEPLLPNQNSPTEQQEENNVNRDEAIVFNSSSSMTTNYQQTNISNSSPSSSSNSLRNSMNGSLLTNNSGSEEGSDSENEQAIPATRTVTNNNTNLQQLLNNYQRTSSNIPLPTITQRLTDLLSNRNDQGDVRRQAQSIALEIIRILFTSSIKITTFLEYYLLVIGCLSFILLVALHTLFCIPPNNYLNAQQRIDYTRNVIINSTEANALQFTKMMKIFSSEQAQNSTRHFPSIFRLGLFGLDYHGLKSASKNETLSIPNATLIVADPIDLSTVENTITLNTENIENINHDNSTQNVNSSNSAKLLDDNSSNETLTNNSNENPSKDTHTPIQRNNDEDDIFDSLYQYFEQSTLYKSIINPLNQFFDKRFYSKPRINCLQNTILQKYRDELINRYENPNETVSPLAAHSYLLRTYIEGPIDKTIKSWKLELEKKNESLTLSESSKNFDIIDSVKYWLLGMYENPGISDIFNDTRLFVYTTERGLFYISRESKQTLQIPVYTVTLDWKESCFDAFGGFLPYVLSYFVGYDTIMFNAFIQYNHDFNHEYTINSGMFYSKQFDEVYYLKQIEFDDHFITRFLTKISPLILYVICFILIYYLVRTTQMNILHLIIELQTNLNSVNQILRSFTTHLFQNIMFVPVLLGVIGFIDNFFGGDQKISLMVFCLIWLAQIFLNNICSSRFSRSVFPWILHFHFGVYLTYYFRYTTGYSYLGFFVCLVLVSEMMLHFWNNYEYHHIMNFHPILRDFLGNNRTNADPILFDRLLQQNGVPILGQQARVQNVQQFVFNLSDMQNQRTTIEQQIGRFNISISLAQDPNTNQANNTTA